MIAGRLPYGARMAQAASRLQQAKVPYLSAGDEAREVPAWVDGAIAKAVHPDPAKRYGELSEFLADLRQPNPERLDYNAQPLLRRNPLLFWQGLSLVLAAALVVLLFLRHGT